ncbi:MAG TPA: caspase family protein [Vicinamibacterales bacterium]|nr:caspase family protein [Vicinamibacterales bacterium]
MSAIIFDETAKYAGQNVLHAIIVGVSDYEFLPNPGAPAVPGGLGLQKLTAAARTATELAKWLKGRQGQLTLPIGTIRLCVESTAADLAKPETTPPAGASGASRAEVATALNEWRAAQGPDDMALFYFAGHGVQRSRSDMVLLCADFNAPNDGPLSRAIELTHIWDGLGRTPVSATIARQQVYFVDACRERPSAFNNFETLTVPDVWGVPVLKAKDDRSAPIFYATTPGTLAYADEGIATLFSKTLLRCLENEAATLNDDTGEWQITSASLERALFSRFRALAGTSTDQECDSDHAMHDFLLSRLPMPPACALKLQIDPDAAVPVTAVNVLDLETQKNVALPQPLAPHPHDFTLPGGYYKFSAAIQPPQAPYSDVQLKPRLIEPSRLVGAIRLKVGP